MRRPKNVKPKRWKLHLEVEEMNKKIIRDKMKDPLYIVDDLDKALLNSGEYKKNKKK